MIKKDIKFIYWGTPDVASKTLNMLIEGGYVPSLVITSPDRKVGRGLVLTSTPVKMLAEKNNIEVLNPEKIDEDFLEKLSTLNFELSIVVAYGKILPESIINMPKHGTLNIHYSLLPKYRGASPLESALLNGDTETGVSIQKMVRKLDAGGIVAEKVIPIDNEISKENLREILIKEGAELLIATIPDYLENKITPTEQDESQATHSNKIKKGDGEIDINDDAKTNYNKYRAYSGWPGTYFFIEKDGKKTRMKITKAKYENNSFVIERVIPEGKKEMEYKNLK